MRWKLWLGIGVSLTLLWLAFRGVHVEELRRSLTDVHVAWLVPVVASLGVRFWLTALRWQVLLRPVKAIGVHRLFGVTLIGFMANNVLPARMGEFVRAYALGKSESLSKSLSFATIVLERVFDGFTLLLFLVVGVVFLHPGPWIVWPAVASFVLYLGVLAGLVWLRSGRRLGPVLAWLPDRFRAPAARLLDSFALGLDVLGDGRALATATALSLAVWLVNVAGVYATFVAFSLDLPVHAAFFVLALVALTLALPSAPGYVGTFQVGTVLALKPFGVPEATALSLSLLYHVVNYIPITAAGFAYLASMNLTLGELKAAGEKQHD
jgi:uncharacterized membrane protein YbhN (UPF0104 family)